MRRGKEKKEWETDLDTIEELTEEEKEQRRALERGRQYIQSIPGANRIREEKTRRYKEQWRREQEEAEADKREKEAGKIQPHNNEQTKESM